MKTENKTKTKEKEAKVEQAQQTAVEQQESTSENQQSSNESSNAEEKVVLPEYTKPAYKAAQLILSKDINLIDSGLKADTEVGRETLKEVLESFPSARFTRIAKTRAIVTAEGADFELLEKWLKNYFKRGIMITAL